MECLETSYKNVPAYSLCQGELSITVLKRGAKLQSIRFKGKELLWQLGGEAYKQSNYGDIFETGEFSGFDDMFPNISACFYPDGMWKGTQLPDHGEVWTQDWIGGMTQNGIGLSVYGVKLPYKLTKHISVEKNAILLDYRAENLSQYPLKYIWAAHPLFILEDGMKLELIGCEELMNVCDDPKQLGTYGEHHPWPVCARGRDMSRLTSKNRSYNKYYVWNQLKENRSALMYPDGTVVTLSAPVDKVPYLGVWTDEDGYGYDMRCAAPEPCTGAFDRLDTADLFGRVSVLESHKSVDWRLTISVEQI